MALMKCVDCGGPVSSAAPACPHCGLPRTGAMGSGVVTIQATAKRWKVIEFAGVGLCLVGLAVVALTHTVAPGLWVVGVGLAIGFAGAVGAWWDHG